ncbi:PREDICTED: leucine zipper protein 4 [Nanorana parkeri]|uniref:leucine zipper protein 4 n=1 Tax=Nanorana parkeri TaxID=125878 RepID=UPI0008547E5F|nr:PREDICTED: leucine zipper protein 4 [Nanorana parkeri]
MSPHPCHGSDRAWLSRCLEVTTESLRELHDMRQEAEDRVRGVLGDQRRARESNWSKWPRNLAAEDSMSRGKAAWRNQDSARAKNSELEHIEEEVSGLRQRNTMGKRRKRSSTSQLPDLDHSLEPGKGRAQGPNDPHRSRVPSSPVHVLSQELQQKMILPEDAERDHVKVKGSREIQERDHGKATGSRNIQERDHGKATGSRNIQERDHGKVRGIQESDHGKVRRSKEIQEMDHERFRGYREIQERDHEKVRGSRETQERDHGKVRGSRETQERDHGKVRGSRETQERDHGKVRGSRETQERDHEKATGSRYIQERDHGEATGSREMEEREDSVCRDRTESWQSPIWGNGAGPAQRAQEKDIDQDSLPVTEGTEVYKPALDVWMPKNIPASGVEGEKNFQPTEPYLLRRIGSGSLAPRLRLGSSGVTSDLLFTRRFSGNCLSTHSSGFYENSDLDSISSSCSSLCSDSSCHTSFSMMSPHRNSVIRPRSIDYTNERRKELQSGRAQPRRPISAGALEGYSLSSISTSRYDITQHNDRTSCDYTYSSTPPLCAIQQRCKAERYICKLALKYRCKPGVSNPLPDLGPRTPRTPASASLYSECYNSCPPSPQINSLSSSLGDVRKTPKGSWGRFFSRVMLKKDSRIAASELNLQHCIYSPQKSLRSPSLADGQLVRAKSFRDLLSVNPFKKSQRGLNKVW